LNDIRDVVTNLEGELTSQPKNYQMLMEKHKQLEKSNEMLSRSKKEQTMSIDERM